MGIFDSAKVIFGFTLPLAVFLAALGAGYIIRRILFRRLLAWTKNTKTRIDDVVIDALRGPFIRYHTFGDYSVDFTVILRAKEFVDQYLIKDQFIERLHERYAKEGIVIPYPIQAVNYQQEKAPAGV